MTILEALSVCDIEDTVRLCQHKKSLDEPAEHEILEPVAEILYYLSQQLLQETQVALIDVVRGWLTIHYVTNQT